MHCYLVSLNIGLDFHLLPFLCVRELLPFLCVREAKALSSMQMVKLSLVADVTCARGKIDKLWTAVDIKFT